MLNPVTLTPNKKFELPSFHEVWEYKDLLAFLVKRDLTVRFKQTFIGVLWIVLQPLIQMLVFYLIFGVLVKTPTDGIPYSVYYLSGFVVWQLFQQIVNSSAYSLVGNIGIITKIYFPRLSLPLSTTLGAIIDFTISFLVLLVFLLANHYSMNIRYLLLPVLIVPTMIFSLGVGLIFGSLMVVFRDTKNLLGVILQVWMFLTPIMYTISSVPERMKIFFYLNPLTAFVDAFRWVFLGLNRFPSWNHLAVSAVVAVVSLMIGLYSFKSMENKIADVM